MAGLQSSEGRMTIDYWARYINVTDTQTDRQARRHSKRRAASGGKNGNVLKSLPARVLRADVVFAGVCVSVCLSVRTKSRNC